MGGVQKRVVSTDTAFVGGGGGGGAGRGCLSYILPRICLW